MKLTIRFDPSQPQPKLLVDDRLVGLIDSLELGQEAPFIMKRVSIVSPKTLPGLFASSPRRNLEQAFPVLPQWLQVLDADDGEPRV